MSDGQIWEEVQRGSVVPPRHRNSKAKGLQALIFFSFLNCICLGAVTFKWWLQNNNNKKL